jgi:hypothetical protein
MKESDRYIIRDYRTGDEQAVTTLFNKVFGKEMSIGQWTWKYSIPGQGKIYSKIAEDLSGFIIGHAGAIPLRGIFRNRPFQFFQIADVMVHPNARGFLGRKNVFDALMKSLFEDLRKAFPDVFCYGFPGKRPYLLGERVAVYERIEQATECVKHLRFSLPNLFRASLIDWDNSRSDDLWTRLSAEFPLSLIRDTTYLHARYASNPFFSYQLIGFFLFRTLTGWAVIRDSGDEVLVIDFLTERKKCMSSLKALERYLYSSGKRTVRLWLPEVWRNNLKGYRMEESEAVIANMVWKLPVKTSVARENLYYTMGDADIF